MLMAEIHRSLRESFGQERAGIMMQTLEELTGPEGFTQRSHTLFIDAKGFRRWMPTPEGLPPTWRVPILPSMRHLGPLLDASEHAPRPEDDGGARVIEFHLFRDPRNRAHFAYKEQP